MNNGWDFDFEDYVRRLSRLANKAGVKLSELMDEVNTIRERDPAAESVAEVLLLYPGLHAILCHRLAHFYYKRGMHFTARAISQTARLLTGIEIHPGAQIGKGLFIDHGSAVVIGETTIIGENCTIYQGVTLGGTGKDVGKRHPTLGNCVMVGAGAKVLGPVNIGDNCKIAAGAVVLKDIPANCTAVGIPARIVRRENVRIDLDQVNIPDPVAQELSSIKERLEVLEANHTKPQAHKAEEKPQAPESEDKQKASESSPKREF